MSTVLVVEDEPAIADAVVRRLRSEGFDARSVADGTQAVELCRQTKPDLVVLDLMLPGLDGLEVCRRIQADRRVPVVMLTARDDETDLDAGSGDEPTAAGTGCPTTPFPPSPGPSTSPPSRERTTSSSTRCGAGTRKGEWRRSTWRPHEPPTYTATSVR